MKALVCEMCNSPHLVKKDGMYVCENCGTRYTVEEAKKLMIEGPVDVSGSTVKVDISNELANLYQIARRAKDDNNSANAAKYYDMILVKDPTSWEAAFYVVYFKAMECTIAQIHSAAISVSNCEDSVLALIHNYVPEANQKYAVAEVVMRSIQIANMLAGGAKRHYEETDPDIRRKYTQEYIDRVWAAKDILYTCGTQIECIFGNRKDIALYAATAWKAGIDIHNSLLPYLSDRYGNSETIISYAKKIEKYDPAYGRQYAKKQLEADIAALKGTIANASEKPKWNGIGIIFIVMGVIMFFLGLILNSIGNSYSIETWPYIIAAIELILGIISGKPSRQVIEQNRMIVDKAKAQLAKKEAELKELAK